MLVGPSVSPDRLAEIKALGSIASGVAVPELIAEIERLRAVVASLMLEAEPELDSPLGASTPSLMSKEVEKRGNQSPARKMNWDRVRREKLLIKDGPPRTAEDGRAELSPMERIESKRAASESRRTIKPTVSAKAKYRTDRADLEQFIMENPELSAAILDAKK
jgi:hypothetical protein